MKILNVLTYGLLNSVIPSFEKKQLVRATVKKMNYSIMKDQIKKSIYSHKYK